MTLSTETKELDEQGAGISNVRQSKMQLKSLVQSFAGIVSMTMVSEIKPAR
jgi:hypothetical protein